MSKTSDIAELAYRLWLEQGQPHGSAEAHWYEAERQIGRRHSEDADSSERRDPAVEESFPASNPPATRGPDTPPANAAARWQAADTRDQGEVTLVRDGRRYGATYTVRRPMLELKTHTETRSIDLKGQEPVELARRTLEEIVAAQTKGK